MIEAYVYGALKADSALLGLLGGTADDTRISPRTTDKENHAIVYKVVPGSFDGFIHTDRVEIRVIDDNDETIRTIQDRVTELLVIREGDPPRRTMASDGATVVFSCKLNGGGDLDDYTAKNLPNVHRQLYFNMIWRLIKS